MGLGALLLASFNLQHEQCTRAIGTKHEHGQGEMMSTNKPEDVERNATHWLEGQAQSLLSLWSFGEWFSRRARRSCGDGLWTISRDGKLVCESLICDACQPE
jgi:hypothetical protein